MNYKQHNKLHDEEEEGEEGVYESETFEGSSRADHQPDMTSQ